MNMVEAAAVSAAFDTIRSGDAGRKWVEHRSFKPVESIHLSETVHYHAVFSPQPEHRYIT
ncbi:hypothetical protein EU537_08205 [Candidatus Thorarchaeota archaeon]|nr:MAG: hypothetical protein EU537_08205 [Candidatus Thorarchaeota archaeon]